MMKIRSNREWPWLLFVCVFCANSVSSLNYRRFADELVFPFDLTTEQPLINHEYAIDTELIAMTTHGKRMIRLNDTMPAGFSIQGYYKRLIGILEKSSKKNIIYKIIYVCMLRSRDILYSD
jgi:hypothetical protein